MRTQHSNILNTVAGKDGRTVPDGYFADFESRMTKLLPETEFEKTDSQHPAPPVVLTRWQRIKPYAYMAAMFAGAWCLLKMFSLMSSSQQQSTINFDSDPVIAEAVANPYFIDEYFISDYTEYDLYEDMMEEGTYEQFVNSESDSLPL